MTNYDVNIVTGTGKTGKEYKAFQLIVHTPQGDYKSGLIFSSSLTPVNQPDFFNDNTPGIQEVYQNAF